jgi:hypothetical protein
MKPPFQYPRRAEADNFRTKVKLVRSAFRSPRSIAVGSHQPRRGPALPVNGFSSAATAYLNRFWSSEVPNHKQCHGPKSPISEVTKNGGIPQWSHRRRRLWGRFVHLHESGFELANIFYQTEPNRATILRGILSYLRQQQAASKFGQPQTDIAPSSGTRPFGVMLSTTRRRCWLSCDRKSWGAIPD